MTTADARIPALTGAHRPGAVLASHVLPVRLAQVACWLLALVFCALEPSAGPALLAALVVGTTSVHVAGRHLAGWALTWVRFRLLRHTDRRLGTDPLLVLAPDLRLRQHHDRAGHRFGAVGVEDGWSAVLRLNPGVKPDVTALTAVLRQACEAPEIPLSGAQLLVRTHRGQRTYLLALRFRPADAPLAALSRGPGELGEHRALTRAALDVLGALAERGYPATVLEAGELAAELRMSLGAQGEPLPGTAVDEGWRAWSGAGLVQTCFSPRADLESAFRASARGAVFTVASYRLHRTSQGRLHEEVLFRVAGSRVPRADELEVPVVPLYGRHEAAVRRTLPLALPH
ncbi:type VII secretion protein EccE [Amycolatopsis sacchari]|uniref:Type VII secretion protein EccE n=1 Tax=Amycolatopsis sacchari TaxID=115433 RepID=A0A1I4CJV6_9PSEU|nr:type VII secretion protein EccE [Amycolatopsis sacchari]SFK80910.1 type VII secretion protein EccE [Amycolatopsis sacchari]